MSDGDKVVGITGRAYKHEPQDVPNLEVIAILQSALKSAEQGYLQEVVLSGITSEFEAFFDFAGEPFNPTLMYGSLLEAAAQYRDDYMCYKLEYDDE